MWPPVAHRPLTWRSVPLALWPRRPCRPLRAGRLGRPRSDALHEVAVEVAARSLLAPAPLPPRSGEGGDRTRAPRVDRADRLLRQRQRLLRPRDRGEVGGLERPPVR